MERALRDTLTVDLAQAARRNEDLRHLPDEEISRDVRDYQRFLLLAQVYPNEPIAPTRAIDRIWHLHMLHPRAYVVDCLRLFGEILDHEGGFGSVPNEEAELLAVFRRTSELWADMFDEPYTGDVGSTSIVKCKRNCVSRCKRACKTPRRSGS